MRTAADRRARIVAGFSNQSGGQWAGRAAAPPSSSTTALTTIGIADRSHESCDSGFNSFYTSIFSLATVLYGNYYIRKLRQEVKYVRLWSTGTDKRRCLFGVWRCYPGGDLQSRPSSQSRLLFSLPSCAARPASDPLLVSYQPSEQLQLVGKLNFELWNRDSFCLVFI